jgi:uncharacterized protein YcbX
MSHHYGKGMSPKVSQLFIYPIKSCAGISVPSIKFDHRGPLLDRNWMLVDAETGVFLSQRELPAMALISTIIENDRVWARFGEGNLFQLPVDGQLTQVSVWDDEIQGLDCGDEAASWFSGVLGRRCRLIFQGECQRLASTKYADEGTAVSYADGFPLLVVADSSIQFLNDACDSEITAQNFRPNIVISNTEVFAELNWERILTDTVNMKVVKPCERCVIPSLNPMTAVQERSILTVLIEHCRRDKKIYFGQNLTFSSTQEVAFDQLQLSVGQNVIF